MVLRDALKETGKVGIGHIVARGHSNLVALRPYHKGLMIETLRYSDEVQKPDAFFAEVPEVEARQGAPVARRGAHRAEDQAVRPEGVQRPL